MAGYIGSKTSVTQVDGYNRTEADAEFVNDPNGVLNISASASSDALTLGADNTLSVAGKIDAKTAPWVDFSGQIQFGQTGFVANYSGGANVQTLVGNNAYYNGGYRSIQAGTKAAFMNAASGEFTFNSAPETTNAGDVLAMTESMKIDSEGRVTMPYQPSFFAYPSSNYAISIGVTSIPCDTASTNVGNHFNTSTNRFTAPVAGQYLFVVSICLDNSNSTYAYLSAELLINNGARFHAGWGSKGGQGYGRETYSVVITLGAGDYVEPRTEFSSANFTALGTSRYSSFSGHLLG